MSKFENAEVPVTDLPDGRKAITLENYVEHDYVRNFVKTWPGFWTLDLEIDCFVSPLPSMADKRTV